MLRKDVKLGFAIGGIMLAVVIVYVLVVPGSDRKNVGVVTDDSQTPAKTDNAPPASGDATATDGKTVEPATADKTNAPPADPNKLDAAQPPATMPSGASAAAGNNAATSGTDWNKLLSEGSSSPTMMSETPTVDVKQPAAPSDAAATATPDTASGDKAPADKSSADQTATQPPAAADAAALVAAADKATPDLAIDTASTPATQPADAGQRTHIVQPGETLTSIAATAYGSSRKWQRIAQANPNINPNKLAPGTKLVIPTLSAPNEASAVTASATIDSQKQYQVQPGDSLYRISMKLYGKADHVDKLYQDNKDTIGSDPKRLKLNMVLKLSDPPTANLASAR